MNRSTGSMTKSQHYWTKHNNRNKNLPYKTTKSPYKTINSKTIYNLHKHYTLTLINRINFKQYN